ncbi:MAG: transferrin-binding protein-like solute binding protein [Haemophilus parahaemolyticus]|uniref:factor H binding protein domain-containing protein n=1 Tax=Haemophilus parahaemolyticus TaxID=735 RepID=UPI0026EC4995|nr:factor H binding protein domain-containing protein [Haemophilus parahaemolyticus]MBS6008477.1 transferrin-binding protein-like solute binding protein [Haemophilus parahaemolyticus]
MKLRNVTLAAALLAVLTGCGSSGGSSNTPNTNQPTAQNEQARQQVTDAKKAEKTSKAEEVRKAEEARKAEEVRKAEEARKVEEARKAEEVRKAEEARKAEEVRKAEEAVTLKKTELFDIAKSIGLPDNIANEYAERFSKNPEQLMGGGTSESYLRSVYLSDYLKTLATNEGLSESETNQVISTVNSNWSESTNAVENAQQEIQTIKQNRAKKETLIQLATQAGIIDTEKFANDNLNNDEQTVQANLDTEIIKQAKGNYNDVEKNKVVAASIGRQANTIFSTTGITQNNYEKGTLVYNQQYSIVTGDYQNGTQTINGTSYRIDSMTVSAKGLQTKAEAIPSEGNATYTGKAFVSERYTGDLSYKVNFADKKGSGSIDNLGNYSSIQLEEGNINGNGISATASQNGNEGDYLLNFFGKNAEEIGGRANISGKTIGFGGTRGEIQK